MARLTPQAHTNGRPGHRTIIIALASEFVRTAIARADGGVTAERLRAAIQITSIKEYASRIREIADLAVNSAIPLELRVSASLKQLRDLTRTVLEQHRPDYMLTCIDDNAFTEKITNVLERPDEDIVFDELLSSYRSTICKIAIPVLVVDHNHPAANRAVEELLVHVRAIALKVRHREYEIARALDLFNMHVGWLLHSWDIPVTAIPGLRQLADEFDTTLQRYYPDME